MDVERIGRQGSKAKEDRTRESKRPPRLPRGGRVALPLLALAMGLAVASIWLISRASDGTRGGGALAPSGPGPEPPRAHPDPLRRPEVPRDPAAPLPSTTGGEEGTTLQLPATGGPGPDFDGLGMLRGHVQAQGVDLPASWTLLVRPSRTLIGREHATTRRVEFTGGEADFRVEGLPFAGYDVEARAPGLNGRAVPILLCKGNEAPFLNLILVPAGFLEGAITDPLGVPQEDVPVTLIAMPEGTRRTTRTDYAGLFRFEEVLDGPYELLVGLVESPLIPERKSIAFRAPSMSLPNIELPPLAGLELRVADDLNRSIPGVEVRASGSRGGSFTKKTDAEGRVSLRNIPEGRLRISFHHPDYKASRAHIDLKKGEVLEKSWVLFQ